MKLEFVKDLGELIAKSGIVSGCDTSSKGAIVAYLIASRQTTLLEFTRRYQWVGNSLAVKLSAKVADFLAAGGSIQVVESTPELCKIVLQLGGREETSEIRWATYQNEAHCKDRKGNLHRNYATEDRRQHMLRVRATTSGLDMFAPHVTSMESADTVIDFTLDSNPDSSEEEQPDVPEPELPPAPVKAPDTRTSMRADDVALPVTVDELRKAIESSAKHVPGVVAEIKKRLDEAGCSLEELSENSAQELLAVVSAREIEAIVDLSLSPAGKLPA